MGRQSVNAAPRRGNSTFHTMTASSCEAIDIFVMPLGGERKAEQCVSDFIEGDFVPFFAEVTLGIGAELLHPQAVPP